MSLREQLRSCEAGPTHLIACEQLYGLLCGGIVQETPPDDPGFPHNATTLTG
jgi:hypothetical protein